ncbi:MAG: response regulator transcription factor [Defluviitaleaceae bacterium]|nr:response regulator transcription factor [Defluviitaleaceae bacterium]
MYKLGFYVYNPAIGDDLMQTIMVVEDDKHINEVVTEYLKEAGYHVLSINDGKAAQEILEKGIDVDLFILDIMLPNVTGLALLSMIRDSNRYTDISVVMLTAVVDEYTQLLSFEELADDYVTKPFSPKILVKRVQALLRRKSRISPVPKGGVYIDTDSYLAYENGNPIKLTLREFELLKLFAQNPKLVFTRQQLLDAVWGYDYFGDERIVDAHIKNLRKKFSEQVIVTVKGVGYRLDKDGVIS